MNANRKEIFFLAILFMVSLAVRFTYSAFLQAHYFFIDDPSSDVLFYQDWARQIIAQTGLAKRAFHGMPLYPYFLAFLMRLLGDNIELIRGFHLVLGSVNVIFIYVIAKRLFGQKVAVLSGILTALSFPLIYYDWLLMPVPLIIFLSCVVICGFLYLDEHSRFLRWFLLGLFLGSGALADGKFLIFVMFSFCFILFRKRRSARAIAKRLALCALGLLLVLASVSYRNYKLGNDFVFLSAHSGINFYIGNNPQSTGTFNNPMFLRPFHQGHVDDPRIIAESRLRKELKPSEVSAYWQNLAVDFIRENPQRYFDLIVNKLKLFFIDHQATYDLDLIFQRQWKKKLDHNGFRIILPLALLGMIIGLKKNPKAWLIVFLILSQLIFTLIYFLILRHRISILPFLIIFESAAIVFLFDMLIKKKWEAFSASLLGVAVVFAICKPVKLNPKIVEFLTFSKSGPIHSRRGEMDQARESYLNALRLQPNDTNVLYNLGNLYLNTGDLKNAALTYNKALRINPFDVDVLYNLAFAFEKMENTEEAIRLFHEVLHFAPQSVDAHYRLIGLYSREARCQEAERHVKMLLQIFPQSQPNIPFDYQKCIKKN